MCRRIDSFRVYKKVKGADKCCLRLWPEIVSYSSLIENLFIFSQLEKHSHHSKTVSVLLCFQCSRILYISMQCALVSHCFAMQQIFVN